MTGRKLYCSELVSIGAPLGGSWEPRALEALLQRRLSPFSFLLPFFIFFYSLSYTCTHTFFCRLRTQGFKSGECVLRTDGDGCVIFTQPLHTQVRQGVESTTGLTIQTWMNTHKLTDLLFPCLQPDFFISCSFLSSCKQFFHLVERYFWCRLNKCLRSWQWRKSVCHCITKKKRSKRIHAFPSLWTRDRFVRRVFFSASIAMLTEP